MYIIRTVQITPRENEAVDINFIGEPEFHDCKSEFHLEFSELAKEVMEGLIQTYIKEGTSFPKPHESNKYRMWADAPEPPSHPRKEEMIHA